jgi:hypothetical protein
MGAVLVIAAAIVTAGSMIALAIREATTNPKPITFWEHYQTVIGTPILVFLGLLWLAGLALLILQNHPVREKTG